jgi:hypothetical protein
MTAFGTLLFAPIEPLVVPAPEWRPETPSVPGTALGPLAHAVRAGLGPAAAALEAAMAGRAAPDRAAIRDLTGRLGALVWPAAARILARAPASPGVLKDWTEAGLPAGAHAPLARRVAALLRHAPRLRALAAASDDAADPPAPDATRAEVRAILDDAAADGADAWTMTLVMLLSHADRPGPVLQEALGAAASRPGRILAARALDMVLAGMERRGDPLATALSGSPPPARDLGAFARAMRRGADLLDGAQDLDPDAAGRRRIDRIRHALGRACQDRLEAGLAQELLARLRTAAPAALEITARDVARLAHAGRRLTAGRALDAPLMRAAVAIASSGDGGALDRVDRARLIEILAGPEQAMAALA